MADDSIRKYLNKARKAKGYTVDELAEQCSLSSGFVRHLLYTSRKPSVDVLIKLCNVLGVSPDYLLQDSIDKRIETNKLLHMDDLSKLSPQQLSMLDGIIESMLEQNI